MTTPEDAGDDNRERLPWLFQMMMGEWQPDIGTGYASVDNWIRSNAIEAAAMVPFDILIRPRGIQIMPRIIYACLRQGWRYKHMAQTAWGVGNIMGAELNQREAEYDLAAILALWSKAIDRDRFQTLVRTLGDVQMGYIVPFGARIIGSWLSQTAESASQHVMGATGAKLTGQAVDEMYKNLIPRLLGKILPNLIENLWPSLSYAVPVLGRIAAANSARRRIRSIGRHASIYYAAKVTNAGDSSRSGGDS